MRKWPFKIKKDHASQEVEPESGGVITEGTKEAQQRIKNAMRNRSTSLDLSHLKLKNVPTALEGLTRLESLILSDNKLISLPPSLQHLTGLKSLYLSSNEITQLPEWIGVLSKLRFLELSGNALKSLPESFGDLEQIQILHLSDNELTHLPKSIDRNQNLYALYLSDNYLKSLPNSVGLLQSLEILHLSKNRLVSLPPTIKQLPLLRELKLFGNFGLGIPSEILRIGGSGADADSANKPSSILDYYFRCREDNQPLNEAKVILVGRGGVGKTSLITQLIHEAFNPQETETVGIDTHHWQIITPDGSNIRLNVWDFGGQDILHGTHQFFLSERAVYILVLSGREDNATEDAEYWLQIIQSFGGNSKVIVVLNKIQQYPFDINRGLLREKYSLVTDFIRLYRA